MTAESAWEGVKRWLFEPVGPDEKVDSSHLAEALQDRERMAVALREIRGLTQGSDAGTNGAKVHTLARRALGRKPGRKPKGRTAR